MMRSLGARGQDMVSKAVNLVSKAVNSNLPHAIGRGAERGVFASADNAGACQTGGAHP